MDELRGISELTDDEWFDFSISAYKELMMLEVENKAIQLSIGGDNMIYVLEERKPNDQILCSLRVPDKIVNTLRNNVVKSSDLKIEAGAVLETPLVRVQGIYGKAQLIASEMGSPGLSLFHVKSSSDKIVKDLKRVAQSSPIEPNFTTVDEETVIVTKSFNQASFAYNLVTNSSHDLNFGNSQMVLPHSDLVPIPLSGHSFGLGFRDNGHTLVYDLRSHSVVLTIPGSSKSGEWFFASSYQPFPFSNESAFLTRVSSLSTAEIFDLRRPIEPIVTGQVLKNPTKIQQSPNGKWFSVSNAEGIIKIYSYSASQIVDAFTHEGHVRMENASRSTVSCDHLWFSTATLISSADNNTINIWQFLL